MSVITKKEVREKVASLLEKAKSLPEELSEEIILETKIIEDTIMDRMFRSMQRRAAAEGKTYVPVFVALP